MRGVVQAEVAADGGAALQGRHEDELAHRRQVAQLHQLPAGSIALVHGLQGEQDSERLLIVTIAPSTCCIAALPRLVA